MHLKIFPCKKIVFISLPFKLNNVVVSLVHGKNSSVHHISRYQFQCSIDSCGEDSKVFSSYLLIQTVLMKLLLETSGLLARMVSF